MVAGFLTYLFFFCVKLAPFLDMAMVSAPKARKRKESPEKEAEKADDKSHRDDKKKEAGEAKPKKKAAPVKKEAAGKKDAVDVTSTKANNDEKKESPKLAKEQVKSRLDPFKFVRPQPRAASPSPPRAAPASPSVDSQQASHIVDKSDLLQVHITQTQTNKPRTDPFRLMIASPRLQT